MACRASILLWVVALIACDDSPGPQVIVPPDALISDAAPDLPALDQAVDAAPPPLIITVDSTPIAACDADRLAVRIEVSAPITVTPVVDDTPRAPVDIAPGDTLDVDLTDLTDGPHTIALDVADRRVPGPTVTLDRTPPIIDWPAVEDACIDAPPAPVFSEPVEAVQDAGRLGCHLIQRVEATDACGHRAVERRAWRVGPPGAPTVAGERAFAWTLAADGCSDSATARIGRVGEPLVEYQPDTLVEWPGEFRLQVSVAGCNGPAAYDFPITIEPGPCDAPTRPLDTPPRIRGWLEIMGGRLVDLSLALSARDVDLGAVVREAATLIAGHPGFPDECPRRQPCSTPADRARALDALDRAAAALADLPDTRAAQRCIAEAARVIVAARGVGDACPPAEQAQAAALVDAWSVDAAARQQVGCLCGGCPPEAACADAPVLQSDPDPIAFAEQVRALGGEAASRCLLVGECAELVAETDAALEAGDCRGRTLLSIARLAIGRRCAGAGRALHPGLLALDAALARWPLWPQIGTAASRADLAAAEALCRVE